MTNQKISKIERIRQELRDAFATPYGLIKQEARFLHNIVEDDEHVKAVIYGLYGENGFGIQTSNSGMLVATDKRLIFIDRKPLFSDVDEFGYELILGINTNIAPIFAAVELHTANKEYHFRNVNKKCARHFEKYIESRVIDENIHERAPEVAAYISKIRHPESTPISDAAVAFLRSHDLAVLSTINEDEEIDAATIYYKIDRDNRIYFMTKSSTAKAHNLFAHSYVALTIFDEKKMSTAQVKGICDIVDDPEVKNYIYSEISKPRQYGGVQMSVPVTKIKDGSYETFCITMTECKYRDYRDKK